MTVEKGIAESLQYSIRYKYNLPTESESDESRVYSNYKRNNGQIVSHIVLHATARLDSRRASTAAARERRRPAAARGADRDSRWGSGLANGSEDCSVSVSRRST